MVVSTSSAVNYMLTMILNSPDFSSRAKSSSAALWPQLIGVPVGFVVTSFIGIVICSSAQPQFGEPIWDVLPIMARMLDTDYSSSTRAGIACISLGFIYVQLLSNVAANSVSAGCDLTALFPRFINIRRGGYIAALVGICMNPWMLFTSSSKFSNYISAYAVLLTCILGPMLADYWIIRRGHYRVADLYTTNKSGWYWYTFGVNWRAFVGYLCGFALNAPGFINTINANVKVPTSMQHVFNLSWVSGTGVSALFYVLCCYASPPPGMNRRFQEVDESAYASEYEGVQDTERGTYFHEPEDRKPEDEKPEVDVIDFY